MECGDLNLLIFTVFDSHLWSWTFLCFNNMQTWRDVQNIMAILAFQLFFKSFLNHNSLIVNFFLHVLIYVSFIERVINDPYSTPHSNITLNLVSSPLTRCFWQPSTRYWIERVVCFLVWTLIVLRCFNSFEVRTI